MAESTLVDLIVADAIKSGYHPRSGKQSDSQSRRIVADLLDVCPVLNSRAMAGEIVVQYTHHQRVGHEDWKIDIAIGTKAGKPVIKDAGITVESPAIVQIAIELKSIWTEHSKARKNRFRDFTAFHSHAHRYDPKTVAGAFLLVNASDFFYSPLNEARKAEKGGPVTRHGTPKVSGRETARNAIDLFRSIHLRNFPSDVPGLEALAVEVIEHDNFVLMPPELASAFPPGKRSRVITSAPAPQPGDPLHYQTFLQRLCTQYRERFPA